MLLKFDLTKVHKILKDFYKFENLYPKNSRQALRDAGQIYIDALDFYAARLKRAKDHGYVKRNDLRTLSGSFHLRSVSNYTLSIYSDVPWANMVDEGGEILHPRMTIPFPGVGISNEELAALRAEGKTFGKKGVIYLKSGKGKKAQPIFKLKGRVPIRATYYSTKAELKATPKIMKLFSNALDEAIK